MFPVSSTNYVQFLLQLVQEFDVHNYFLMARTHVGSNLFHIEVEVLMEVVQAF